MTIYIYVYDIYIYIYIYIYTLVVKVRDTNHPLVMNGIVVKDEFRLANKQVDYCTMCVFKYQ